MMAHGFSSLSYHEYVKLLRSWGFVSHGRGVGGHNRMIRDGKTVQFTAPGRRKGIPYVAVQAAARAVGVPVKEFLAGPSKEDAR